MAYLRANSLFYDCKWFLCCRIWFMWQYGHIWVNIVFTDDLVPSWHQNICNHNDGMSRRENISKGLKKCSFRDTFFQYYMHEYSISLYMIISDSYYISVCNYHITKLRLVPSTLESKFIYMLTHWGRVTHICVRKLTIIDSDNGLSPGRRQAIALTNDGISIIEPLETNFSEILIGIQTIYLKKMRLKIVICKMAAILSWPQWVN